MMEFDQTHFRFYTITGQKLGKSATEIHLELNEAWKDRAPSLRTVQRWMKDFNEGTRTNLDDAPRSGRPRSTRTEELSNQVADLIKDDPHLSSRDIAELLNCNQSTILRILSDDLELRWVCSVWVPHDLTAEHRQLRVNCAKQLRRVLLGMKEERYNLYAVQDETWVPWNVHGTKTDNKTWLGKDEPRRQVVRQSFMTRQKSLLMVTFTPNKRFSVTALPYGVTVNAEVMVNYLRRTGDLWRTLRSKPVRLSDLRLQMDNARPHTARPVTEFLEKRDVTTIWQSPYSPDLNLCDRFLFLWLKNSLRGMTFSSSEEVESASLQLLRDISETALREQVDLLLEHCQKVIDAAGQYITE